MGESGAPATVNCLNGGTATGTTGDCGCDCGALGFSGTHCEVNIDDCVGHDCANGSVCVDGINAFTCARACEDGWTGTRCDVKFPFALVIGGGLVLVAVFVVAVRMYRRRNRSLSEAKRDLEASLDAAQKQIPLLLRGI